MVVLMCKCFNVTIYLEHAPTKQDGMAWLLEYYNNISKGIGKATLAVAGVTVELPQLTLSKTMNKEWTTWKCLSCLNCDTFIYASRNNDKSQIYVNCSLIPKIKKDDQILQHSGNQSYSPVWKVVLYDEDNCSNNVLETPDDSVIEAFKKIESQMSQYLSTEEGKMKQRIREYEELQNEAFKELQTRVYRDRKVLWHTIMKKGAQNVNSLKKEELHTSSIAQTISSSRDPSPLTTPTNTPIIEDVSTALVTSGSLLNAVTLLENHSIVINDKVAEEKKKKNKKSDDHPPQSQPQVQPQSQSQSQSQPQPQSQSQVQPSPSQPIENNNNNNNNNSNAPKSTWVKVHKDHPSSDNFMFKFEEDSDGSEDDLPIPGMDDSSDDEVDTKPTYDDYVNLKSPDKPKIVMASSVPVSIPQNFANFIHRKPDDFEPSKPRQPTQQKKGNPSEADLSKSFAVPVSRTKITGWI